MRSRAVITTTLFLLVAASCVYAGEFLLWDNYPGDVLDDPTYNLSSERNTQVIESTWAADDVDILQTPFAGMDPSTITLTRLEWVGARHPDFSYSLADVIVLDSDLNDLTAGEYWDLTPTYLEPYDPDPNPDPAAETYRGELSFSEPIPVPGEHFYIGVRLVGDGYYQGRNHFVTSLVDSDIFGRTEGYVKAAVFGAPDWTPASDVWYGHPGTPENFEFAFRVWAIPEPASLVLLSIGGLLLAWRR